MKLYLRILAMVLVLSLVLPGCGSAPEIPETTTAVETTAPIVPEIPETEIIEGRECYNIEGAVYAAELGAPVLGKEKVSKLLAARDYEAAAEAITNIGDAFYYRMKIQFFDSPEKACDFFLPLIVEDYDSAGLIKFHFTDNFYCMVYVEQDGIFYAIDPHRPLYDWVYKAENDCFSNSDLNVLSEKLLNALPFQGTELLSIDISIGLSYPHGAKTFSYAGSTIPEGLGQPVLSDEEIDALILEQNYAKTAETITTLADAVNYYKRAGITFYDKRNNNSIGKFSYVQSAWQVLKSNEGQCVSMSNVNHYLLQGDYDEVGYVLVYSPGDGHIMSYILEDGIYYLINSVDYTYEVYFDWLEGYPNVLGCAEDFQSIADSLMENMQLGDKKPLNLVHLVKSPGDFVRGEGGRYYPIGCEVVPYYGIKDITYLEAGYEWDTQTRIDY